MVVTWIQQVTHIAADVAVIVSVLRGLRTL